MAVKVANYEFAGHVSRVVRFFSDLAIEVERRRARRMTRAILTGLTDAQLTDIGVNRLDVFRMR
ncbi:MULTISPECIES: DUF1127 domain-containing protein [Maritimibacter]|jgi:uncharacterized protein YjiS (DUF1127 family)|uniref:YjiS-like domain-containing protein n=1 Tax=Maritimibacter alkaliphilus HTCC2654 TaxID=314271 RepID=A3VLV9_9RHOB|nr:MULTISPECIES: DUF1127 domain-containing protein [Maritimibacter]EAQ10794.1 hypothetical protein RB2654_05717 [Rhodobacterales bacterium HTCC2654] [Maritimibacter alkaliphilus HTCC2654]MBL6429265.1 DUF1127 domain-containing protein [Maritimibacter sp.]TYP81713.1 uncharacterized protein DUF1127 [Maritimibacter alkaliphilus HTCC2654]